MKDKILAVQRMQDYIKDHIDDKITLANLAKEAKFSPFYCIRIFKELTGITPDRKSVV